MAHPANVGYQFNLIRNEDGIITTNISLTEHSRMKVKGTAPSGSTSRCRATSVNAKASAAESKYEPNSNPL